MEIKDYLTCIGLVFAFVGGWVALFNARKAVQWKRADLANSYLKELTSDETLVFACRALDWGAGRLVVPKALVPLLPNGDLFIEHDDDILAQAMPADLLLEDLLRDPRIQLYRTAMDTLFSWLAIVSNALDRDLFRPADIREVGYWVNSIEGLELFEPFIDAYGYRQSQDRLRRAFS